MQRKLLLGADAIARGAYEAGVSYATSYPGTPATHILEAIIRDTDIPCEWSVNEKVALEVAYGASLLGRRVICSMKHVGLNVAADPLMTISYLGVRGGLVIAMGDDPGAYSSQNEQDSRFFAYFAKVPCLEPYDGETAKAYTKLAFELSDTFHLPVILRTQTRLLHCYLPVTLEEPLPPKDATLVKDPDNLLPLPKNILRLHRELNAKQPLIEEWIAERDFNRILPGKGKVGIIACGLAVNYALEFAEDLSILRITGYPVSQALIAEFVSNLEEVIVLENGYPLVERMARCFHPRVKGKLTGDIPSEGELSPDVVLKLFGKAPSVKPEPTPPRPPTLCPGCPHREFFKALVEAGPTYITGDIGCYTLGALPPLNAMDTCLCMGIISCRRNLRFSPCRACQASSILSTSKTK